MEQQDVGTCVTVAFPSIEVVFCDLCLGKPSV